MDNISDHYWKNKKKNLKLWDLTDATNWFRLRVVKKIPADMIYTVAMTLN